MRYYYVSQDDLEAAEKAGVLNTGQAAVLGQWLHSRQEQRSESIWSLRMLLLYVGLLALALAQWWLLAESEQQFNAQTSITLALLLGLLQLSLAYVLKAQIHLAGLLAAIGASLLAAAAARSSDLQGLDSDWSSLLGAATLALSALLQLRWIPFPPLSSLVFGGVTAAGLLTGELTYSLEEVNLRSAIAASFAGLWLLTALRLKPAYASWAHAASGTCVVIAVFIGEFGQAWQAHLVYLSAIAMLLLAARRLSRPAYLCCSLPLVISYMSALAERFLPEGIWSPLAVTALLGLAVGFMLWRGRKTHS